MPHTLVHEMGPVGGISHPSDEPAPLGAAPILFGGERPTNYFVSPVSRFQSQDNKNACTAHGGSKPIENQSLATEIVIQVCRADLYSKSLYFDGNEGRDVGVTVASMTKAVEGGLLSEWERPWGIDDPTRRSPAAWDGRRAKGLKGVRLAVAVDAIKDAIMVSGGVGFGHPVHSNYKPDAQGVLPTPAGGFNGYHYTCWEGWRPNDFLMAQSWKNWGIDHPLAGIDPRFAHLIGKRGYCWMPWDWLPKVFEPTWFSGKLEVA